MANTKKVLKWFVVVSLILFVSQVYIFNNRLYMQINAIATTSLKNLGGEGKLVEHKGLHLPHCHSPCLQKFGKNGSWVQDWNFAELHGQYEEPWVVPPSNVMRNKELRFRPQDDAPFRWPTSWKWVDTQPSCPVVPLTQSQMCEVLQNLNISRIAFFGDSLTGGHYTSFLNLMGPRHITELGKVAHPFDTRTLLCSNTEATVNSTIRLFHKRDTGGSAFPHSNRTNYTISGDSDLMNFTKNDDDSTQRALWILNIGAHYHNMSWYEEDMRKMLLELGSLARSQDLYFFRTTPSGHRNVINRRTADWTKGTREVPFESYMDFLRDGWAKTYDWNLFELYNKITKDFIHDWHTLDEYGSRQIMHILDVFNMTVLRYDGHTDGLHYSMPGPVDWWSHLLFTYLQELRNALVQLNATNCIP